MDYEKMSTFYTSSTKLTQTNCLATPTTPTLQPPPPPPPQQSRSPTRVPLTTTPSFKLAPAASTNAFLAAPTNATATTTTTTTASAATTTDPYSSYADNFDLSLLPQDCASSIENNIPTIVYQYAESHAAAAATTTPATPTTPTAVGPATPQIKIEQFWSNSPRAVDEIKQEPLGSSSHQLIPPPPPYPSNYPSPQSSPAQSEYCFPQTPFAGCYDSISSSRSTLYPASPYPTLDASSIKQELHILPPSPPESNCEAPSPHCSWPDIKAEPIDADVEMLIDLNALLEKKDFSANYNSANSSNKPASSPMPSAQVPQQLQQQLQQQQTQNHQLLREFLENNTFQLGCIDGMDEVNGNIEQVISKALEDTKSQAVEICAKLQISQDPSAWSTTQVHAWLHSTIAQFKLPQIDDLEMKFREDGAALILLTEEEFKRRAPESGSDLYAQLEVWRYHFNSTAADSDDEDDMLPTTSGAALPANANTAATTLRKPEGAASEPKRTGRSGGSHIHLWQFLKELLAEPHCYGTAIRWIDRARGIFKIEDSVRVAKLWGNRKNRPAMNYDKLSRSIRQYYKKGIMKKTERSQRLVYQFCAPYQL